MNEILAHAVMVLAALVAAYAGWHTLRDAPFSNPLFYAVAALELVLVAVLVSGSVALNRTDAPVDGVLFISYLVTNVVIAPVAVLWGVAEKSRWGTGVVVVALFTIAVLMERVLQIWQAGHV